VLEFNSIQPQIDYYQLFHLTPPYNTCSQNNKI
jgi:hypothetical protein